MLKRRTDSSFPKTKTSSDWDRKLNRMPEFESTAITIRD